MAAWGFTCANCNKQFAPFRIEDTLENYFFPEKPDVPKGGKEFECPNCGHKAMYQRSDLTLSFAKSLRWQFREKDAAAALHKL